MATVTALSLYLSLSVSLVYRRQVSFCTASLERTIHALTKTYRCLQMYATKMKNFMNQDQDLLAQHRNARIVYQLHFIYLSWVLS